MKNITECYPAAEHHIIACANNARQGWIKEGLAPNVMEIAAEITLIMPEEGL